MTAPPAPSTSSSPLPAEPSPPPSRSASLDRPSASSMGNTSPPSSSDSTGPARMAAEPTTSSAPPAPRSAIKRWPRKREIPWNSSASDSGPPIPVVAAGQVYSGSARTVNPVQLLINNGASHVTVFRHHVGGTLPDQCHDSGSGLGTGDVSLQATAGGLQTPSGVLLSLQ